MYTNVAISIKYGMLENPVFGSMIFLSKPFKTSMFIGDFAFPSMFDGTEWHIPIVSYCIPYCISNLSHAIIHTPTIVGDISH